MVLILIIMGFLFIVNGLKAQPTKNVSRHIIRNPGFPGNRTTAEGIFRASSSSCITQHDTVLRPYLPLQIKNHDILLLGRKVILNDNGFPEQIQTFFSPAIKKINNTPKNILGENIHFHFVSATTHKDILFKNGGIIFTEITASLIKWTAVDSADQLRMEISGCLKFNGVINYSVNLTALQDIDLLDTKFHIPFEKSTSKYLMGLGNNGGLRPDTVKWKWDAAAKDHNDVWIGDINAGLQYSLVDEHHIIPLHRNLYDESEQSSTGWGNGGKGGILIAIKGHTMLCENYTGPHKMKAGDVLNYNFKLLITPVHLRSPNFKWITQSDMSGIKDFPIAVVYDRLPAPGTYLNNYPAIAWRKMKKYGDSAQFTGARVNIYTNIHGLKAHSYETFHISSLGNQIYPIFQAIGHLSGHTFTGYSYVVVINPITATLNAFPIKNFRPAQNFRFNDAIPEKKGKYWILTLN